MRKCTVVTIRQKKLQRKKIAAVTAYDYPTAWLADRAGLDIVLTGDSLGMCIQGLADTLPVTMDEMVYHTRLVRRGVESALLVADMPYGSYHLTPVEAVRQAIRLVKEGGADAVKIEGGKKRRPVIEAILDAEIPVMGHLGLTPQSVHSFGGYKIQGRNLPDIETLLEDALLLESLGCFSMVLEGMPHPVARIITKRAGIPAIGIGAGPGCDGQILVFHDLLGFGPDHNYKFVRRYADLARICHEALTAYAGDVRQGTFPSLEESFGLETAILPELEEKYGDYLKD